MTLDMILEEMEEQSMKDLEQDMLGDDDDVGYYDYDDDGHMNAADGVFDAGAMDSCWDKSG